MKTIAVGCGVVFLAIGKMLASDSTAALRFFGTGTGFQDRVLIPVSDNKPGSFGRKAADIGWTSFTVEFWIKGNLADNVSTLDPALYGTSQPGIGWTEGNVVVDRDIWVSLSQIGDRRDWGVSIRGGRVAFGTGLNQTDLSSDGRDKESTLFGATNVLDGGWHHVAVVRNRGTREKSIYVDGQLDATVDDVSNDALHYPGNGLTRNKSPYNPFLVLGAEKHDVGFPFTGYLDEVRVWNAPLSQGLIDELRSQVIDPVRYPDLAGYWRFEEAAGTDILDSKAAPNSPGTLVNGIPGNGERVFAADDPANTPTLTTEAAPAAIRLEAARLVAGLKDPVFVTAAPGDPNRMFIVEKGRSGKGRVLIHDLLTGSILPTPFFSIGGLRTTGEVGLLGMTFDPDYATNGFVYFSFTKSFGGALYTQVNRYQVSASDPNVVDVSTGKKLLFFRQPFANHNGGWLGFGPDGFLYFASGDGGSGNDPGNRAQNLSSIFGKILRIDPDSDDFPTDPNRNYAIPPGNPFQTGRQRPEIFCYGLRNPWRCSFDRVTGDLWIGDVGQGAFEEISFNPAGVAGLNFGWRPREGNADNPGVADRHPAETMNPLHAYGRSRGRSVTGGYVYRGSAIPALQGYYVFGDFITGRVWAFRHRGGTISDLVELTNQLSNTGGDRPNLISSFGEDSTGELYIVDFLGEVFRLDPAP